MVAQLNSLIRVELHLVKETTEQVSLDLELIWTSKLIPKTASFIIFMDFDWQGQND
jgi:hypothetical protein